MKFEKIILNNYRQYQDTQIEFNTSSKSDLHLIIGKNGLGKTNLLNAINWCFYEDEPHLGDKSKGLTIVNLSNMGKKTDQTITVSVEIWINLDDEEKIVFTRSHIYEVYPGLAVDHFLRKTFTIQRIQPDGRSQDVPLSEQEDFVDRIVPRNIREYFFFDGERLDNYFKEETSQNIQNAIFRISQIDLLKTSLKRLETIQSDLKTIAKKENSADKEINSLHSELESNKSRLDSLLKRKEELVIQIGKLKELINECSNKLKSAPDVTSLENRRIEIDSQIREIEQYINRKKEHKNEIILRHSKCMPFYRAYQSTLKLIEEKKKKKELPPTIDRELLKKILHINECTICNRALDKTSKEHIENLYQDISMSSDIGYRLIVIENNIKRFLENNDRWARDLANYNEEIQRSQKQIETLTSEKQSIDKKLVGYNIEQISHTQETRQKSEEKHDELIADLGKTNAYTESLARKISEATSHINVEMLKKGKNDKLRQKWEIVSKMIQVLENAEKKIIAVTREEIKNETKQYFLNLVWKKDTFKDVLIKDDYSLSLIHSAGYECLGSISSGERELLALAFTLALHKVSGFEAPILIDTPVARVSDSNRENFCKIFLSISQVKQIILLLTSAEYSEDVRDVFKNHISTKKVLTIGRDEKITYFGEA